MSLVNINNKITSGINEIEEGLSLSEWAAKYVSSQELTRENHQKHIHFRSLSRRQKDAIRYQLKKGITMQQPTNIFRSIPPAPRQSRIKAIQKPNKLKILLGIWIAIFLLFDVVKIYEAKGASSLMAWQAAILVELCIVCAAMSLQSDLRRVAYALFAYNILIFGFMEIDQALIKNEKLEKSSELITSKEAQIHSLKTQIAQQQLASSDNLKRLSSSHEHGYITSGSIAYERVSRTIKETQEKLSSEVLTLENEILNLKSNSHTHFWIWVTSLLYFLLRCVLQFFSIKLLEPKERKKE